MPRSAGSDASTKHPSEVILGNLIADLQFSFFSTVQAKGKAKARRLGKGCGPPSVARCPPHNFVPNLHVPMKAQREGPGYSKVADGATMFSIRYDKKPNPVVFLRR